MFVSDCMLTEIPLRSYNIHGIQIESNRMESKLSPLKHIESELKYVNSIGIPNVYGFLKPICAHSARK